MNKDELKSKSKKKVWRILKICYRISNFLIVLVLIALTSVLIHFNPHCDSIPAVEWYEKSNIYSIDSNQFELKEIEDNIKSFQNIKTNAILLNNITEYSNKTENDLNDLILKLNQNNIKLVINFMLEKDTNWLKQSVIDKVDGFFVNLIKDDDTTLAYVSTICSLISNNNVSDKKKRIFLNADLYDQLLNNQTDIFKHISKVSIINDSIFKETDNLKNASNWKIDSDNPLIINLALFLSGSRFITISKSSLSSNDSLYYELSNVANILSKFDLISFGKTRITKNQDIVSLERFFIGEPTLLLIINSNQADMKYDLQTIFNDLKINDKKLDKLFVSGSNITDADISLPPSTSLAYSWPYIPPGFNEIL